MGEVYRARDARLDRDVAIKALPASFSNDEERLSRFEQEARATSTGNNFKLSTGKTCQSIGFSGIRNSNSPHLLHGGNVQTRCPACGAVHEFQRGVGSVDVIVNCYEDSGLHLNSASARFAG